MSETDSLLKRMQTELDAGASRLQAMRQQSAQELKNREAKLAQFGEACERLSAVWKPRFEAFAGKFGEKVKLTPTVTPTQRDVTMVFTTGLAAVSLRLAASAALESGSLVLDYELSIIPMLMDYERHAKLEVPLDKVDPAAVGKWIDDRLIDFVKTFNAMHENEHYLKDTMVEDPVAKVRFPKHAAACSLERGGKTTYFVNADSMKEFEKREAAAKAAADAAAAKEAKAASEAAKKSPDVGKTATAAPKAPEAAKTASAAPKAPETATKSVPAAPKAPEAAKAAPQGAAKPAGTAKAATPAPSPTKPGAPAKK